jgi:putative salt-induced outer membrane protein YdiY
MSTPATTRIRKPFPNRGRTILLHWMAPMLFWLAATLSCPASDPAIRLRPVLTTNYVVITNIVIVTNYVPVTADHPAPDPTTSSPTSPPPTGLDWAPPPDDFDWIQLKSGEWLKGRLKAMQERKLEFDSEKLDDLTFDWKDIRQLRSPRMLDVLLINGETLSGPLTIKPGEIRVGGNAPRQVAHTEVQSVTPGGRRERNYWSGKGSLGLTLRAGNTEQMEFNAKAHLQRRTPSTRLTVDYIGNSSSSGGAETANNHRVNSEFDLWLSRRFYLILPFAEYYKDPFQNLSHRITAGAGAGYSLIDRPDLEWNITSGPGFQKAWFDSYQPGQPASKGVAALIFGSRFDWEITRRIDLLLEYRGQYTSREVGETTHHAVTTLSLDITRRFDLDVSFVWDRISVPKIGADGSQPRPDDFRLVLGVGLDF